MRSISLIWLNVPLLVLGNTINHLILLSKITIINKTLLINGCLIYGLQKQVNKEVNLFLLKYQCLTYIFLKIPQEIILANIKIRPIFLSDLGKYLPLHITSGWHWYCNVTMMDGNYLFIYPLGNIVLPNYSLGRRKGRKMRTQPLLQKSKCKITKYKVCFIYNFIVAWEK